MHTREGPVKLLSQLKWKVVRKEAVINNGYGSSASVGSTEYTSRRSDINTFVQNENSLFGKDLSYFLLGNKDKIYKATKVGFIKAFADHKKKLKTYFSEETIDFRNTEHLKALLEFCNEFNNS
jgi:hypothetical protein